MKIKVNQEACISCGACEAICPDVFELNDEGLSTCKKKEIKEDLQEQVQDAMDSCPTGAIILDSEDHKEN